VNLVLSILAGSLALVAGAIVLWRVRTRGKDPYYYFRCPGCEQKVRYLARLAGRAAACPRCRQACDLPKRSEVAPLTTSTREGYRIRRHTPAPTEQRVARSA
jgi:hypothetical protein